MSSKLQSSFFVLVLLTLGSRASAQEIYFITHVDLVEVGQTVYINANSMYGTDAGIVDDIVVGLSVDNDVLKTKTVKGGKSGKLDGLWGMGFPFFTPSMFGVTATESIGGDPADTETKDLFLAPIPTSLGIWVDKKLEIIPGTGSYLLRVGFENSTGSKYRIKCSYGSFVADDWTPLDKEEEFNKLSSGCRSFALPGIGATADIKVELIDKDTGNVVDTIYDLGAI